MSDPTKSHTNTPTDPIGNWALACSILLGSLLVGVFMPVFLLISGGALLWVVSMMRRATKIRDRLGIELEEQGRRRGLAEESLAQLRDLIDAADIPILATDEHGQIVQANRRAFAVMGIGEAMIGRRFDEVMPEVVLSDLESLARGNEPGHATISLPIAGEMRSFDVSGDPIESSRGAVLTFRDITELSRAMTLKTDFVANASHELRTPIASIKCASETLSGPARADEHMSDRLIEMISSNAQRLEMLAFDLLDLSKLENEARPAQIEEVGLGSLIKRVLVEFESPVARRGLTIVQEIEDGFDELLTDPSLLELILRNLVQNAIKFAHEGTTVRVVARRSTVAADRALPIPSGLDRAMGMELSVIDKGIGIPLPHQQRVFERFYQVDDARSGSGAKRGTGLGLAIVKHAARRLGGRVKLESVYQSGTTLTIELPRCVDPEREAEYPAS